MRISVKIYISFCLFLIFNSGFSQNQNKIWYFGDHAGLDFNSGSPVALSGGAIYTNEGCSSIADNSGNLLFYTDGITVWNNVHSIMPNGSGLSGNPSTTQSALIIPLPGSSSKYYIFTIDALGGAMTYSIVDMTLAAGLGDVTSSKNIAFHPAVSEKQCAVQRCDGNIWIVSHQSTSNTFYADLITPSGISPSVLSSVGTSHAGGGGGGTFNTVGQMKFSQQGDRLALALRDAAVFEVFNFNITTGVVSSPISINPGSYPVAYGVEFSPDGTKLYGGLITSSVVYQFNLMAGSAAAISSSATMIGSSPDFTNSLQLGPDGKIYVAKSYSQTSGIGALDVINNPNALGSACNYVSGACSLGSELSLLGLPGFMVRPLSSPPLNITVSGITTICSGQNTILTASGGTVYTWSGSATSSSSSINVSPTFSSTYYVSSSGSCGSDTDTVVVNVDLPVNITAVSSDDSICSGQSVNLSASGSSTYQWTGGVSSVSSSVTVSPIISTTYYVSGSASACPADIDTLIIYVENPTNINISGSTNICTGQSTTLSASGGGSYLWSGGTSSTSTSVTVSPLSSTMYYVSSNNSCGNDIDSISVQVDQFINVTAMISNDSICAGQTINLSATGSSSYLWSGGITSTASSVNVNPGATTVYYVSGTPNACPLDTDTLTVFVETVPNVNITGTPAICNGQSTILTAAGGTSYTWSGGISSTAVSINVSPSLTTTYYVTSPSLLCGAVTDSFTVTVDNPVNVNVTVSSDTICRGQSVLLTANGSPTYQWTGALISSSATISATPLNSSVYFLTGLLNSCGSDTDTIIVHVDTLRNIYVSANDTICAGDSVTLMASGGTSYNWSGAASSVSSAITVAPVSASVYYVSGDLNVCGRDVDTITVTVNQFVQAQFSFSADPCSPEITFNNLSPGTSAYLWLFGDGSSSTAAFPEHNFTSGIYNVTLYTNPGTGCKDSISETVTANASGADLMIPNVFTPNQDNVNDVFKINGLSPCKKYDLVIFNRWGQKVFQTDQPEINYWNGNNGDKKEIVEGVYYYILSESGSNGINGMVTLLK